jgi:spermidine synthase
VELGDARRSLAREETPRFDLLVLDAFSSDAIPVHLMTREALALYLQHLGDGGLVVFHISNRHLALRPLVGALLAEQHLAARAQFFRAGKSNTALQPSEWVVAGRGEADLGSLATDPRWERLNASGHRVWSDDFSDILSVLKL